jgi:hypothetical protein
LRSAAEHDAKVFIHSGAEGRVTGPDDPESAWVDAMGRKLTASAVAISTSPVYLVGPAGKAKAWLETLRLTN